MGDVGLFGRAAADEEGTLQTAGSSRRSDGPGAGQGRRSRLRTPRCRPPAPVGMMKSLAVAEKKESSMADQAAGGDMRADKPQEPGRRRRARGALGLRRHRLLVARGRDRPRRDRRRRVPDAREPHRLEDARLGARQRHRRRRGERRGRHRQERPRAPAGAALLRRARRGRALGERPQLPQDAKSVRAVLELDGGCLEAIDGAARTVEIAAGGEARADWRVRAVREGEAVVRVKALTDEESDAMEQRFPVRVHGMLKTVSWSGAIRREGASATFAFTLPAERRVGPDAPRGALLADARRRARRRPALPRRLPLRLHRADAQPLPPRGRSSRRPCATSACRSKRSARSGRTSTPRSSATRPRAPASGSG